MTARAAVMPLVTILLAIIIVACPCLPSDEQAAGRRVNVTGSDRTMMQQTLGSVTLTYSRESEPIARDVLAYADQCNRRLAEWFGAREPVKQTIYWMSREDWSPTYGYGFPSANGSDALVPAPDVDLPTELAIIADAVDFSKLPENVRRIAPLLGLSPTASADEVRRELKESKGFFVAFVAYFIVPHEMIHGYCNALGYPQQPRWWYEGAAQWGAYCLLRDLRSADEADLFYEYYGLLWDSGPDRLAVSDFAAADAAGAGGLDTPNYAWYHAGLLKLHRDLETMKAAPLLPELVQAVRAKQEGGEELTPEATIGVYSQVVGRDLRSHFLAHWGLGGQ